MGGTLSGRSMPAVERSGAALLIALIAFVASVVVTLATIVDMRRAFLLDAASYQKLGSPSAFLSYTPWHILVLVLALVGGVASYRVLRSVESVSARDDLKRARTALAAILMAVLIVDLFTYRIVQAERVAAAGKAGVAKTFAVDALPAWLRPLGEAVNFLLVVWHATLLGMLIGALFLVLLCSSQRLKQVYQLRGLRAHLLGSASAVAYPFCSCCAGPVGASLYRGGASLESTLAFVVAAPLLNVTTLFLATALLPADFALLRIVGGAVLAVFGTWLVALTVRRRPPVVASERSGRGLRWLERSLRAFALEDHLRGRRIESPADLVAAWLATAWRIARVAVPMLLVAATVIGWVAPVVTALSGGNTAATVLFATLIGVLFMIPTWTELAIAAALIQQGLTGPAAALLLALPAVSLPSLVIYGAALRDWRVPALLVVVVVALSAAAGLAFLR
ncbi:permease [Thermomicrobium sp. 4228-Ro]|uniref:permease n=1 Tax=Thermomicrobium sp. 4228-Ro TaxID=2993937 RepID=UPI00224917C8|nr:permease [Thermomicrobium sp. 4228-Ro]MCX2727975.1 permease [Thermomicrobium sp. 4228-Ro]